MVVTESAQEAKKTDKDRQKAHEKGRGREEEPGQIEAQQAVSSDVGSSVH